MNRQNFIKRQMNKKKYVQFAEYLDIKLRVSIKCGRFVLLNFLKFLNCYNFKDITLRKSERYQIKKKT